MDDLETRMRARLALLTAERERRAIELAQFEAAIAELELLLAPPAAEALVAEAPEPAPTHGRVGRGRAAPTAPEPPPEPADVAE